MFHVLLTTNHSHRVRWVSWPGGVVDTASRAAVRRRLEAEHNCTPVFLTQEVRMLVAQQHAIERIITRHAVTGRALRQRILHIALPRQMPSTGSRECRCSPTNAWISPKVFVRCVALTICDWNATCVEAMTRYVIRTESSSMTRRAPA